MERSQSYSSFEERNSSRNNNTSNNNSSNLLHGSTSSASLKLLKAVEIRETLLQQHHQLKQQLLQQQQQQQLQQQLVQQQLEQQLIQQHHQQLLLKQQKKQQQHQQQQQIHQQQQLQLHQLQQQQPPQLLSASQQQHIQESHLRLQLLQRQASTTAYLDEVDYAADLEEEPEEEEEEEDDELERTLTPEDADEAAAIEYKLQHVQTLPPLTHYQKQQQFQQRKPQSAAALIMRATSITSASSAGSSNCCCSSSSSSSTTGSTTSSAATAERRRRLKHEESFDSAPADLSPSPMRRHTAAAQLQRDNSVQSDSSRYSSVDSLLESRKPDPEVVLINLGFGPAGSDILSRIPKRFLKPSQVRGNDTNAFVRHVQLAHTLADHSVLGYRGLTGNPDLPPSSIVAKIMKRFELYQRKKSMDLVDLKQR